MQIFSASLVIAGAVASTYVGGWLGRSFSIFPQARHLVTRGPYRFIRHPLYVAEQIATFGVMLQFAQPWSIVVALASVATQFPRMHYEEQVLSEAYPSYRDYAARTARLIPHIY
jgi:protein-S-isoprenylcysteine O-methyltransferase Ste14